MYLCTAVINQTADKIMATQVKTVVPVDSISGMLGTRKNAVSKKAFVCNISKAGNVKSKGSYMYLSLRVNDRASKPGADEVLRREKFAAVVRATRARLVNPQQVPVDIAGFAAQKKYPTIYGYVFSKEWADYEG